MARNFAALDPQHKRRLKDLNPPGSRKEPPPKDRTYTPSISIPQPYLGKGAPVSAQQRYSKRFQGLGN